MRELIWLIIGVLVIYVLFQLYRVWTLRKLPDPEEAAAADVRDGVVEERVESEVFVFEPASRLPPDAAAPSTPSENFQAALDVSRLRQEVDGLRSEAVHQQAVLEELSATIRGLREQIEALGAGQGISPEYNEALVCARRGLDVGAIAERCGISVAEAELVQALSRQGEADRGEGA